MKIFCRTMIISVLVLKFGDPVMPHKALLQIRCFAAYLVLLLIPFVAFVVCRWIYRLIVYLIGLEKKL